MAERLEESSHFFEVRLDLFDGPIDLLLHLVKARELPIEKLSLAAVATQYFHCIEQVRAFDLEIAGEYVVIAATLLSIKSSVLLNEPVEFIEDEEGNLIDPHAELLRKLKEAEIYKDGASALAQRDLLGVDVFPGPVRLSDVTPPPVRLREHSAMLLAKAFQRVLDKGGDKLNLLTISVDSVSIVDRMMGVINNLKSAGGSLEFTKLLPSEPSKGSLISLFVALLELCKRQIIMVRQTEVFEEIAVVLATDANGAVGGDQIGFESEFDAPPSGALASNASAEDFPAGQINGSFGDDMLKRVNG